LMYNDSVSNGSMAHKFIFGSLGLVHLGGTVGQLMVGLAGFLEVTSDAVLSHVDLLVLGLVGENILKVSDVSLRFKSRLRIGFLHTVHFTFLTLEEAHADCDSQHNSYEDSSCDTEKDDVDLGLVLNISFSGSFFSSGADSGSSSRVGGDGVLLNGIIPFEGRSLLLLVSGFRSISTIGTGEATSIELRSLLSFSLRDFHVLSTSVNTEDRSTKEHISFLQLGSEFGRQSLKSSVRVFVVVLSHNEEINNDGTLIDSDHLDGTGVDAKDSSDTIGELNGTTIRVELIEGPVQTDLSLDRVLGFDCEGASRSEVHLKDVLDSDEAVLTTPSLRERLGATSLGVPLAHLLDISLHVDLVSSSVGVRNLKQDTSSISIELVTHFTRRSSSVLDGVVITTLDKSREARQTELS